MIVDVRFTFSVTRYADNTEYKKKETNVITLLSDMPAFSASPPRIRLEVKNFIINGCLWLKRVRALRSIRSSLKRSRSNTVLF